MNLNQVQEGHVFSITQRSTAMSNWARVVYTIIHVQSRRQECCFYDDAPTTYYPACCPICDIATNNVNPFWTAVDASPSWPHLHFCPFPQSSASSACRGEKTDVIHTSGSNLGEGGSHLIVIWLLFIRETFLQIFFKIFMRLQSQIGGFLQQMHFKLIWSNAHQVIPRYSPIQEWVPHARTSMYVCTYTRSSWKSSAQLGFFMTRIISTFILMALFCVHEVKNLRGNTPFGGSSQTSQYAANHEKQYILCISTYIHSSKY